MFKMAEIKVEEIEVVDIITTSDEQPTEAPSGPSTGNNSTGWG